jgi:hypothetical protein
LRPRPLEGFDVTQTNAEQKVCRVLGSTGKTARALGYFDDSSPEPICYRPQVNSTHRKTLQRVLADPVNGNIEWARIEALLKAAGCRVVEGAGSSVTFESDGRKMTLHRPHPGKEALRYRVLAVREFIARMGIEP